MKLTLALHLYRRPVKNWQNRYFKYLWRMGSIQLEPQVHIPQALRDRDVNIIDTRNPTFGHEPRRRFEWPDARMNKFRDMKENPLYHEDFIYVWKDMSWPRGGLRQAQNLSKSLVYHSALPARVEDNVGKFHIASEDELMRRCLVYAHVTDGTRDPLPIERHYIRRNYRPPRKHGIPYERQCVSIISGMARLCDQLGGTGAEQVPVRDYPLTLTYDVMGDRLQIRAHRHQILYTSRTPLPTYANAEEVAATANTALPDIFPLKPVAGMYEKNVYRDSLTTCGFHVAQLSQPLYPRTLFLTCAQKWWGSAERVSRALVISFAQCMALAIQLYGPDCVGTERLERPICVKTVITNGHAADLVCFQLNTLKYDNTDGIKNMAWVDGEYYLYESITPGTNEVISYNEDFLPKLFALFMDG